MEITSPPYPRKDCNSEKLYELLLQLGTWVEDHREWAEQKAKDLKAPYNPFLIDLSFLSKQSVEKFKNLAIPEMFLNFQALRNIRNLYDGLVRNYEEVDLWDSDNCAYGRLRLLQQAAGFLDYAFLDAEKREAKANQAASSDVRVIPLDKLPPDFINKLFGSKSSETISDTDLTELFNGDDLLGDSNE
jgi:hypothetical protein